PELRVDLRKSVKRIVESNQFEVSDDGAHPLIVQCHPGEYPSTFRPRPCSRMVDEDSAHRLRPGGEKVPSIHPDCIALGGKPRVCLMDECCWIQRLGSPLTPEVGSSYPTQIFVEERHQLVLSLRMRLIG